MAAQNENNYPMLERARVFLNWWAHARFEQQQNRENYPMLEQARVFLDRKTTEQQRVKLLKNKDCRQRHN